DARDVAQDALPVGGPLQAHDRVGRAVEHDDGDLIGGRQRLGGGARGLLGEVHLGTGHRPRLVDDQRQRQRRLLAAFGNVEANGKHLFKARRHVTAGAEALRAARDQQPAAAAHEAVQRRQRRFGQLRARYVGQRDQIVTAEVEVAGQAAGGPYVRGNVFGGERARERSGGAAVAFQDQDTRIVLGRDREDALVVLGMAIAAGGGRADVQRRGAGFVDAHGERRGGRSWRERQRLFGLVDDDVWVARAVQTHARLAGAVGEQVNVDAEGRAGPDVVGRGQAGDRDVAAFVGGQREREQGQAAIAQPFACRDQIAARRNAVADEQQARDGGPVDQTGAEADRQGQIGGRAVGRGQARERAILRVDLLGARRELDHAWRRIAAFGGGAGQRRDGL